MIEKIFKSITSIGLFSIQGLISSFTYLIIILIFDNSFEKEKLNTDFYLILALSSALLLSTLLQWLLLKSIDKFITLQNIFKDASTESFSDNLLIFVGAVTVMGIAAESKIDIGTTGINFAILINICTSIVLAYKFKKKPSPPDLQTNSN